MADGLPMIPGAGAAPGGAAMPHPPMPPAQGAPPQGASPATSPVPNKGLEVAGLAELSQIVRQLEQIVPKLGISSEAGRAVAEAALKLARHVPTGSVAPGPQMTALQGLQQRQMQIQPLLAAMRAHSAAAPVTPVPAAGAA